MSTSTSTSTSTSDSGSGMGFRRGLASFMAVSDGEWEVMMTTPRLGAEVVFHTIAVLMCSSYFGWIIFRIASGLLAYPLLGAATLGVLSAFGLGTLDRYVRIQSRGAAGAYKAVVWKVRFATMSIVAIGGFLMAVDAFHADIDRVLAQQQQNLRLQLESAPQNAPEIASARAEVEVAMRAMVRSDELRSTISRLNNERARELAALKDEVEGNITGNVARKEGRGPKARGHETAANRLSQEAAAAEAELAGLTDAGERLQSAQERLAVVNHRIGDALQVLTQGPTQRVAVMFQLMAHEPAAWIIVTFWILIGLLPDFMIWIALGRSTNDDAFALIRRVQDRALSTQMARYAEQMRDQAAAGLKPLEVRLVAGPSRNLRATLDTPRASNEAISQRELAS